MKHCHILKRLFYDRKFWLLHTSSEPNSQFSEQAQLKEGEVLASFCFHFYIGSYPIQILTVMPEIFCCDFTKRPKGRRGWSFCISLFLPDCPPEPSMCKKSLCARPSRWSSCWPRAGRLRAGHRAGGENHLPRIQE